jgi:DNA repair protein RadC
MAKSTQERSAKAAKKREQYDEKELRHKVRPGIHQAMDRIRERSGTEEISEVMQLAILKMDAMTDAELIEFLKPPSHVLNISQELLEQFDNLSRWESFKSTEEPELKLTKILPHGPSECAEAQLDILSQ